MISLGNITTFPVSATPPFGNHNNNGDYLLLFTFDQNQANYDFIGYAGQQATLLASAGMPSASGYKVSIWGVANPAAGVNQATTVRPGGFSGSIGMVAISYIGAWFSQPDSASGANSFTSPYSPATTVINANCWLIGIGEAEKNPGSAAISQNRTSRATLSYSGGSETVEIVISDSNGTVSTGSQSIQYTFTGSQSAGSIISLQPIPPPASSSNFLLASY